MVNNMDDLIRARIELLKQNPFYGRLALMLELKEQNDIPTAATDGEYLYYNKDYIKKMTPENRQAIILHEMLHVALGHIWRRDERIHHVWNIACDYAVNAIVYRDGFIIPEGWMFDRQYINMGSEMIYDKIKKNFKQISMCGMGGGGGGGGKEKKDGKGNGGGGKNGKDKQNGANGGSEKCPCGSSHKYWGKAQSSKSAKRIKAKWEGAISDVAKKTRGTVPAEFERMMKEMQPKENWKRILMSYLSVSTSDFDFLRRDRRTLDTPFYIPDLRSEEKLDNIVCVVDTSGSIGGDQLNRFLAEIKSILKLFPNTKGWFINCDAEIHDSRPLEEVKKLNSFAGGGGTDHNPVFREIERKHLNPKVVICFTDLYTSFPDKKPNYPVLWLVTQDGRDEKVPFGRIIKLSGDI